MVDEEWIVIGNSVFSFFIACADFFNGGLKWKSSDQQRILTKFKPPVPKIQRFRELESLISRYTQVWIIIDVIYNLYRYDMGIKQPIYTVESIFVAPNLKSTDATELKIPQFGLKANGVQIPDILTHNRRLILFQFKITICQYIISQVIT